MLIPICVNAKNEQNNILNLLESLFSAKTFAEKRSVFEFSVHVVLDDCTDMTKQFCQKYRDLIILIESSGGLIQAQRRFVSLHKEAPWYIFSDADIVVSEDSLLSLCQTINNPCVQVAYLEKKPLPVQQNTLLARALYDYNLNNGYQSERLYFNGQFFAIKEWAIPRPEEINFDTQRENSFLNLKFGVRCDDIYLSRSVLSNFGKSAIQCVDSFLYYRPPETFDGMFKKYQRMVLEIERLNILFPDLISTHKKFGVRKSFNSKAMEKGLKHFFYFQVFKFFLIVCRFKFGVDRILHLLFKKEYKTWKPVKESKVAILKF